MSAQLPVFMLVYGQPFDLIFYIQMVHSIRPISTLSLSMIDSFSAARRDGITPDRGCLYTLHR